MIHQNAKRTGVGHLLTMMVRISLREEQKYKEVSI